MARYRIKMSCDICLVFSQCDRRLRFYFTHPFAVKFIFAICKKGDKP